MISNLVIKCPEYEMGIQETEICAYIIIMTHNKQMKSHTANTIQVIKKYIDVEK